MGHLTENQLASVRMLIQAAPDSAVRDLETTLSSGSERHETMRLIHNMVMAEAADRRGRNAVFRPVVPLCHPLRRDFLGLTFPPAALAKLWRGLKTEARVEVAAALAVANDLGSEGPPNPAYDALCLRAAAGLRERSNDGYAGAAAALDQARPDGSDLFAAYLDLVPVSRAALDRMSEWLGRLSDDRIAAARVAFRDAVAVAEDAGPRLLEVLYAHLEEPWAVLRLVSAVMHRPSDKYVAGSELAVFGERLLDDIDARLKLVSAFAADNGRQAGLQAGDAVRVAALQIQEFDESMDLSPEGPWGSRLTRQKRALGQAVEGRLKAAEAEVAAALPLQSSGFKKGARGHPRLTADPDPRQVNRARAFLVLLHEVRGSADRLGFGSLWGKVEDSIEARLDTYIEDLLEKLRGGEEGQNPDRVKLYLDIAAEFLGLASGDKAAQIVRRRVAAAA